jgi:hypothetical protein
LRLYYGATTVYDSGAAVHNGGTVTIKTTVIRTGAATQKCFSEVLSTGAGASPIASGAAYAAATETLSGAVTFRATMTNGTANAGDITCRATNTYFEGAGH